MNSESYAKLSLAQSRSGLSIRAFCQKHGIPVHSFYYWRRRSRSRPHPPAKAPSKNAFVEISLAPQTSAAPPFRLDFKGAALTLPPTLLRQCLEILRGCSC